MHVWGAFRCGAEGLRSFSPSPFSFDLKPTDKPRLPIIGSIGGLIPQESSQQLLLRNPPRSGLFDRRERRTTCADLLLFSIPQHCICRSAICLLRKWKRIDHTLFSFPLRGFVGANRLVKWPPCQHRDAMHASLAVWGKRLLAPRQPPVSWRRLSGDCDIAPSTHVVLSLFLGRMLVKKML